MSLFIQLRFVGTVVCQPVLFWVLLCLGNFCLGSIYIYFFFHKVASYILNSIKYAIGLGFFKHYIFKTTIYYLHSCTEYDLHHLSNCYKITVFRICFFFTISYFWLTEDTDWNNIIILYNCNYIIIQVTDQAKLRMMLDLRNQSPVVNKEHCLLL